MNTLRDLGPKVKWGVDVNQALDEATVTDPNTVVLKFKIPSPRFFFFATYKYDIGIYIVPKHIFQGQDWTSFKHFDIAKGWPVTTGPWKVVESSLQQKVFERRDNWWAAEQKLAPMPPILRNIWLPMVNEQKTAQAQITNHVGFRRLVAARDLPHGDPAEPEDHLVFRAEAAVGLCRLVADLALRQQRGQTVRRQGRALGAQPLHRPPAGHRSRLSRGRDGFRACRCRRTSRCCRISTRSRTCWRNTTRSSSTPRRATPCWRPKGFKKNGGMWETPDGKPFTLDIIGFGASGSAMGPVLSRNACGVTAWRRA